MMKIGILGLNTITDELLSQVVSSGTYVICGVYDVDSNKANAISEAYGVKYSSNPFGIIAQSELLVISKTDENSYHLMVECILNTRSLLIINPENLTIAETENLCKLATEACVLVVPYLSRLYNETYLKGSSFVEKALFINVSYAQNLAISIQNNKVIDIIDYVLKLANGNVKKIIANAYNFDISGIQLLNCRMDFDNGCVANILIDFNSHKNEFNITVYQQQKIVNLDLLNKQVVIKNLQNKLNYKAKEYNKIAIDKLGNPFEFLKYFNANDWSDIKPGILESFLYSQKIFKKIQEKIHYSTATF